MKSDLDKIRVRHKINTLQQASKTGKFRVVKNPQRDPSVIIKKTRKEWLVRDPALDKQSTDMDHVIDLQA